MKVAEKVDFQEIQIEFAECQGYIIRKDVEATWKVSLATPIQILWDVAEKGLLIIEGAGKQRKYQIAG